VAPSAAVPTTVKPVSVSSRAIFGVSFWQDRRDDRPGL
jgi:hypothetical protein